MNTTNTPSSVFFSLLPLPRRQWNSDANSIGRTNYPFTPGIGNARDIVELLFEPRKKEGEISNKGKGVSKEDRKDDLTRSSLHEFFFPLHEFLRHFSSRGERGDSKNVSKRKLEIL